MTGSSIYCTHRLLTLLHRSRPVWLGLYSALLVLPVVWAQSAPVFSTSSESDAAQAFRLGMSLVEAGRLDEAIPAFKNGLLTDPHSIVSVKAIGSTSRLQP